AKRLPAELAVGIVVGRSEDLEVRRSGDGRLHPQDASRLVVHLDRVAVDPVLDPDTFGAVLEAGRQLADELAVSLAAEKAHDVGTLEMKHRVARERRKNFG